MTWRPTKGDGLVAMMANASSRSPAAYLRGMHADRLRPIAVVFGTRPEAIKLAPVVLKLREREVYHVVVTTGQHRELVDRILSRFDIDVDADLDLMRPEQS